MRLLVVGLAYLAAFALLTWPALRHFADAYLTDAGDGMQNVWNLWWIHEAVCVLHRSPFYTTYLHFPEGTTLIGHTLNPLNGLLVAPFFYVMPRVLTHNAIVIFAFVASGMTAFLLCRHVAGSTTAAFVGGFVFTFSSFHFAHAEGHMQLISLEGIPLFLWTWLRWLERPGAGGAVAAGIAFLVVLLCDLYFTLYCVLAAVVLAAWWFARGAAVPLSRYFPSATLFAALGGLPAAGYGFALWSANRHDPFVGVHDPDIMGMDVLAPFVYGGHWRFASWTRVVWGRLPGNIHESSLHVGWVVLGAIGYAGWHRRRIGRTGWGVWVGLAVGFALLALGPVVHVAGHPLPSVPMPYRLLATVFPPLQLAGVPARFFVMTTLACSVLVALAVPILRADLSPAALAIAALVVVVETLPAPLPITRIPVPGWVPALAAAPAGGVIDLVSAPGPMLYYQTIHAKPLAVGYIARYPLSTLVRGSDILGRAKAVAANDDGAAAAALAHDGFRYLVTREPVRLRGGLPVRWAGDGVVVYDLPAPVPSGATEGAEG